MAKDKNKILGIALFAGLAYFLWPKGNQPNNPAGGGGGNAQPGSNASPGPQLTPTQFVNKIKADSLAVETAVQVPHLVTMAVSSLESGWGNSALAKNANNYFGIEADPSWTGPTYLVGTQKFRAYPDMTSSAIDFGNYLRSNGNYDKAFTTTDPATFALAVAAGGYGGADAAYGAKLVSIITQLQNMGQ